MKSALVALTLIFFLSACADMEPAPQPPLQDEVKEGPGLLTGEKGGFVVSREFGGDSKDEEKAPVVSQAPGAPPAVGQGPDPQSAAIIERQAKMLDRQSQMLDRQTREIERLQNEVDQLKRELESLRSRIR
jgi:hypothetical protein